MDYHNNIITRSPMVYDGAIVVKLPGIGLNLHPTNYSDWQLCGLAAGTLDCAHILIANWTRHIITVATLIKLIPVIGIGLAVMDQQPHSGC